MDRVRRIGNVWFGYGRTRVLGPFPSERRAWRELEDEDEL